MEAAGNISFEIQRTLSVRGEVTVNWVVLRENGSKASEDFVQPSGSLLFADGLMKKVGRLLMSHFLSTLCYNHDFKFHFKCVLDPYHLRAERQPA